MKKFFALALLCLSVSRLHAQANYPKTFLYLYSDSIISAEQIIYESGLDGTSHFIVDSRRVHPEQVKFFQNEMGFFANTRRLDYTGQTSFSERIREGKINLYEGNFRGEHPYSYYYSRHPEYASDTPARLNYYNIGFGGLKKATYENLRRDLVSNEESMFHLQQYQKSHSLSKKLLIAGGAAILGGLVSFVAMGSRDTRKASGFPEPGWIDRTPRPNLGLSLGLILGGAGLSGVGALKLLKKSNYLKEAVDTYNYSR